MKWFEGTTDAVRQFTWVFEDAKNRNIENILILYRDHLYRMNYMDFVQQHHIDNNADFTISCAIVGEKSIESLVVLQIDGRGQVFHFAEKPKGSELRQMGV
uniref:Nucleotidyl transferase domain-containing protein n=1 Tax=Salix viminalis TaxID=40686 RepID=A0A6N2LBV5_SALVM